MGKYTDQEEKLLKNEYIRLKNADFGGSVYKEVSDKLSSKGFDRSPEAVRKKVDRLGLPPLKENEGIRKAIVISDLHIPYQDKKALSLVEQYMDDKDWDIYINLGDHMDFDQISHFNDRKPRIKEGKRLQDDYEEGKEVLQRHRGIVGDDCEMYYLEGNHECLDEETEVLTSDGWKDYQSVSEDDEVWTLDVDSNEGEWGSVEEKHVYDYDGEMYHITSMRMDTLVTPNHRILHKRGHSGEPQFEKGLQYREISDFNNYSTRLHIPISNENNQSDFSRVSDDELRFAGWFLSDGHFYEDKRGYMGAGFSQSADGVDEISSVLDSLGVGYSVRERNRKIDSICGKKLKKEHKTQYHFEILKDSLGYVEDFFDGKRELPDWLGKLSRRQFDIFLDTYIKGDGSVRNDAPSKMIYTSDEDRVDFLQYLLVKNGYTATVDEYRKGEYRLNVCEREFTQLCAEGRLYDDHIEKKEYKGDVWCLTVDNGNFLVRRNGKVYFTGNSRVERYLDQNPEHEGLMEVPTRLNLDDIGVNWIKSWTTGEMVRIGEASFTHGNRTNKYHSFKMASEYMSNIFYGHCHDTQSFTLTSKGDDSTYIGQSLGCLCQYDQQYKNGKPDNWQIAFGVFHFFPDGNFNHYVVRIFDYKFVAPNGEVYSYK